MVKVIGKISTRRSTKERSTKIGEKRKKEIKTKDNIRNRKLGRMMILTIEDQNK
jgi:hypothetical protein